MKFQDKLTEYGYTDQTVSAGVKKDIKDYHKLAGAITDAEAEITKGGLSERRLSTLTAEVAEGKEELEALDEKICKGIERFKKNAATYKKQGERMNAARKNGTGKNVNATGTEPPPAAATSPTETPTASTGQATGQAQQTQQTAAAAATPPVKKEGGGNAWGWILGLALAAVGIGGTIYYVKNKT